MFIFHSLSKLKFADDTSCTVLDWQSIEVIFTTLKIFSKYSGLTTNLDKSTILWLGPWKKKQIPKEYNLKVLPDNLDVLGLNIGVNVDKSEENNFHEKINKMEKRFTMWKLRNLTILGRILIAKTFGMSNLIYSMSILDIPKKTIKIAQQKINQFIWEGGLKAPDLESQNKALRLVWLNRLAKRKSWSQIAHYYFDKYGGFEFLLKCNYDHNMLEEIPTFYRLMLEFLDELIIKPESNNILWNNKEIKINGRTIFLKEWFNNGIMTISDMLKENNLFYTIKELEENFNIKTNFVTYYGITQAIRKTKIALNKILYNNEPIRIVETFNLNQINITSAKSRAFYNEFILLKTHEPSALNTWVNEINRLSSTP